MTIARTAATGGEALLPELLAWSSSLEYDREFAREDILGSLAHVTMLGRTGVVPAEAVKAIRGGLLQLHAELVAGKLALPADEEDVHMAIERLLSERLGAVAGHLHTARSRNDQVALDLRLYSRERARRLLEDTLGLVRELLTRAEAEREVLLPAYTHRQRAQPVSAAMYFGAWSSALLRAAQQVVHALDQANVLPLGACASSGTSLPIDREITRELLGFARVSFNALDTVGDRDFELDVVWACTRVMLALSRLAEDMVDFATSEFGLISLDGSIATGSSMMPQKKNPDVFELVRGKSAGALGRLVHLLSLVKALPTGYNRDLQEDRSALFGSVREAAGAVSIVRAVMPHVHFNRERCAQALAGGFTQATDLAEALVKRGTPFREAYKAAGALVRFALDRGLALDAVAVDDARAIHPQLDAGTLGALEARRAAGAKESQGGTGPTALAAQLAGLAAESASLQASLAAIPSLDALAQRLAG
jgi:argininosuccinate lyase